MAKYRKRPVVIEAWQFTEETKNQVFNNITCNCYPDWDADGKPALRIQTLEGEMTANIGDWIIRGVAGEFYPCKPDIFEATYEGYDGAGAQEQEPVPDGLYGTHDTITVAQRGTLIEIRSAYGDGSRSHHAMIPLPDGWQLIRRVQPEAQGESNAQE